MYGCIRSIHSTTYLDRDPSYSMTETSGSKREPNDLQAVQDDVTSSEINQQASKPKRGRGRPRKILNIDPITGELQRPKADVTSSEINQQSSTSNKGDGDHIDTLNNGREIRTVRSSNYGAYDLRNTLPLSLYYRDNMINFDSESEAETETESDSEYKPYFQIDSKRGRGRPRKIRNSESTANDLQNGVTSEQSSKPKRGRGRPRNICTISELTTDDLEVSQNLVKSETQFQTEYELLLDSETESETSKQKSSTTDDLQDSVSCEQFSKPKKGRGRPRTIPTTGETDSETSKQRRSTYRFMDSFENRKEVVNQLDFLRNSSIGEQLLNLTDSRKFNAFKKEYLSLEQKVELFRAITRARSRKYRQFKLTNCRRHPRKRRNSEPIKRNETGHGDLHASQNPVKSETCKHRQSTFMDSFENRRDIVNEFDFLRNSALGEQLLMLTDSRKFTAFRKEYLSQEQQDQLLRAINRARGRKCREFRPKTCSSNPRKRHNSEPITATGDLHVSQSRAKSETCKQRPPMFMDSVENRRDIVNELDFLRNSVLGDQLLMLTDSRKFTAFRKEYLSLEQQDQLLRAVHRGRSRKYREFGPKSGKGHPRKIHSSEPGTANDDLHVPQSDIQDGVTSEQFSKPKGGRGRPRKNHNNAPTTSKQRSSTFMDSFENRREVVNELDFLRNSAIGEQLLNLSDSRKFTAFRKKNLPLEQQVELLQVVKRANNRQYRERQSLQRRQQVQTRNARMSISQTRTNRSPQAILPLENKVCHIHKNVITELIKPEPEEPNSEKSVCDHVQDVPDPDIKFEVIDPAYFVS